MTEGRTDGHWTDRRTYMLALGIPALAQHASYRAGKKECDALTHFVVSMNKFTAVACFGASSYVVCAAF